MLIDSNILVYAVNKDSDKHRKAVSFLKNNESELVLSHQNILEAIRVSTHPKYKSHIKPQLTIDAILLIASGCRIISPNYSTYYIFLDFIKSFKLSGNMIFDAYLVATVLSNGIDTIATDNTRDFKRFTEIKIINPFA